MSTTVQRRRRRQRQACFRKRRYPTKAAARRAAIAMMGKHWRWFEWRWCQHCAGFHVANDSRGAQPLFNNGR